MTQLLLIAIAAIIVGRDAAPGVAPLGQTLSGPDLWLWCLGPQLALCAALHLWLTSCGRALDRTGSWRAVRLADFGSSAARFAALAWHAYAIFGLGLLESIRAGLGQLILVDEALAAVPPLLVFLSGWASFFAIDRRLREASLLSSLDRGDNPPALLTRSEYVLDQVRHQLLFVLLPVGAILAWDESTDLLLARLPEPWSSRDATAGAALSVVAHGAGIAAVLLCMPEALRRLWRTVPLGPGPLRDRLLALCDVQRVRIRELLVWRTHSRMLNGAVVGLVPRLRYVLLTDALLETLTSDEVEAVMGHEIGHARKGHLPWLLACVVSVVSASWLLVALLIHVAFARAGLGEGIQPDPALDAPPELALADWLALPLSIALSILLIGWISRRFEQQADAFAVQHLSGHRPGSADPARRIGSDAVAAMSNALRAVAAHNHIPEARFSWRHGSIRTRRRRLEALIGQPASRVPIDRTVGAIKLVAALGVCAFVVLASLGY